MLSSKSKSVCVTVFLQGLAVNTFCYLYVIVTFLGCSLSTESVPDSWKFFISFLTSSVFLSQATDNGSFECTDGSAVPAVRCSAVPQQPRATAGPHPAAPGAALSTVHATALPGPAGSATGNRYKRHMFQVSSSFCGLKSFDSFCVFLLVAGSLAEAAAAG